VSGTAGQDAAERDPRWLRWFPFLAWFPVSSLVLRGDVIAGITGALVLVPKAMAYAQLSGLPVHFGLYVALVPAIVGALWGSSRQLATGPVAIVSLMTAAALTPLAVPFSVEYIELALLLTLMVGVVQFALGAFKLGSIVNFVSHPVILGFMNAAAIIIALSQLDMLLGIPKGRGGSFLGDIWEMLSYLPQTHLPTLAMSAFALVLMLVLKRIGPIAKLSVLIAVVVTIVVSAALDYERSARASIDQIADAEVRERAQRYAETAARIKQAEIRATEQAAQLRGMEGGDRRAVAALRHQLHLSELDAADLATENKERWNRLQRVSFERTTQAASALHLSGQAPPGQTTDGHAWRIKKIVGQELHLAGGGDVVGSIPQGLPALRVPKIGLEAFLSLLSAAVVIALVGFMESIAMAKALAAKTRQRIDPNQELIGQGLANLTGSFFQSYPACGSFTGSAINLQAGAKTGLAMVFNGLFVAATLLVLTPLLYHLPKATLGVIILLAVTSLITPAALKHAWHASRADGLVAAATFVLTLLAAPHLDKGILMGAALAVGKLLGFNATDMAGALGAAGAYAGGLAQFYHSGGVTKRLNGARGAESGVMAALLTQAGIWGPRDILEGEAGFFRAFSGDAKPEKLTGDLGKGFRLMEVSTKIHAGAGRLQATVDAGLALSFEHQLVPLQIVDCEVGIPKVVQGRLTQLDPPDLQSAQLSIPFSLAMALSLGRTRGAAAALRREDYADAEAMRSRWGEVLAHDGAYNPNLEPVPRLFELAMNAR